MNSVLKRFVERGWIMLTNVNLRKLSYVQFFFFQRIMKTSKGEAFEKLLFPGYVFFQIEKLTAIIK